MSEKYTVKDINKSFTKVEQLPKLYEEIINKHLNELQKLEKECETDASKSSNNKRYARSVTFFFGIVVIAMSALAPAVPEKEQNLRALIGTLTALAGAGVTITSQYFDYTRSRQRALDLKQLKRESQKLLENSQLKLLKLDSNSEIKEYEELFEKLQEEHEKLENKGSQFGVGI